MIGRSCIRNPWIFRQIEEYLTGKPIFSPTFKDVRGYIDDLYQLSDESNQEERFRINYLKKFLNFIGISIDSEGQFLYQARRCKSKAELDTICDHYLINEGNSEKIYPLEPIAGLVARPNCEIKNTCSL
jgi:tRNA-dihydrouridine synthase